MRGIVPDADDGPVIFSPDDEPYLGRAAVLLFDQVFLALVAEQYRIGPWTRAHDMTPLQRAASEIVPGACSLAFSIRELVRQGYLLAARILLRPFIERVSTLTYLIEHDETVADWHSGWPHRSRPNLHTRLRTVAGPGNVMAADVAEAFKGLMNDFNGMVHGDPASAHQSAILLPSGEPGYTVTKDLGSPSRVDEICSLASTFAMALTVRAGEVFPST